MKRLAIAALLLASAACATSTTSTTSTNSTTPANRSLDAAVASLRQLVPPNDTSAWHRIRKERVRKLLPAAMRAANVDAWLVLVRENDNDPLALHVAGENAGGTAAIVFFLEGDRVRSLALSPSGEATALRDIAFHDEVRSIERGANVLDELVAELRKADPKTIAVNSSGRAAADGLSFYQRRGLEGALRPDLTARLVSSEELVVRWLGVKLPEEVEIMRRAAIVTSLLEEEAYAIVRPGVTRDVDVARHLKQRMRALGFEDAWAPEQNPNVNSGPDRGHSHATERVILHGDIIQTDFGIKVGGVWSTDIQRFAYVLRPGETAAPAEVEKQWQIGRQGSRIALGAMKPGVRGYDVDAAQRAWMKENNSEPVPWSTGHPVGYWAHDMGPSLGGAQREGPPRGDSTRLLEPGMTFAFDGFFAWPIGGGATKTVSVEEMAVVTANGAEYLMPPQEALILIRP